MEQTMVKWVRMAFVPAVGLSLVLPAFGATQSSPHDQGTITQAQKQQYRGLRASQMIGKSVKSPQGKNLGQIEDLIVDMNNGKVRYAMLRFDPGIFSGERLFAVPTTELRLAQDKDDLIYNMTRERLENADVAGNRWPSALKDRDYLAGVDRKYGVVQPAGDRRAFSASELLGKDVNGAKGEEIGEIRDLVIDMNNQRVHYAVLEFDPGWTAPEKLYAFPLTAFMFNKDKDELALDVDKSRLQRMRSFDHGLWTAFSTPVFVTDIDRYLITFKPVSGNKGADRSASASAQGGSVTDAPPPNYTVSMQRLQNAAQKLRESIQAMAQQPAGEARQVAIRNAQQALYDTNQAMIQLPPQLRTNAQGRAKQAGATGTTSSAGAGGTGGSRTISEADYGASMKRLQTSAQQLRSAIQAMSQQQQGERRDNAIKEAHQALYDANEAMAQVAAMAPDRK